MMIHDRGVYRGLTNWDADFIALSENTDLPEDPIKVQSKEASSIALSVLGDVDIIAAIELHVRSTGLVGLNHGDRVADWENNFLANGGGSVWKSRSAEGEGDDSKES